VHRRQQHRRVGAGQEAQPWILGKGGDAEARHHADQHLTFDAEVDHPAGRTAANGWVG
jgi:hypothetical protein